MNPASQASNRYLPAIDGLRAIAVLMVLVFHFDLLTPAHGGFMGVDVFFVISGFLITSIINPQIAAGSFKLGTFYLRRVRRLAPALFATLLIVASAGLVWLYPSDLIELSKQVTAAQTYVANIYYWKTINYFGIDTSSAFLLHTWSLAVEEQFYLIYPFFLIAVHRYAKNYVWQFILSALILSFGLNIALVFAKPEATFYLLPTRAWELLLGALVVWLRAVVPALSRMTRQLAGALGVSLIGYSFIGYEKTVYFPGYFALLPTIGSALVILVAATGQPTLFSSLMSNRVATYIGRISYPLYLIHWPIHIFAVRLMAEAYAMPATRWLLFALSLVMAAAIFHCVEEPIRTNRIFGSTPSLRTGYLAGVAATLLLCITIYATNGMPQRYPAEAVRLASFVNDKTQDLPCQFKRGTVDLSSFCKIGRTAKPPTWLIYGDSHAWAAYAAFDKWLARSEQSALFIFRPSCPPLLGIHRVHDPGCFEFNNQVLGFLNKAPEINNVLLVSTWLQAREGFLTTSEAVTLSGAESIALFKRQFIATISLLKKRGMGVVIWEPVPGARRSVPLALAHAYPDKNSKLLEITEDQYFSTFDYFFDSLNQGRDLIDATVSPAKALCRAGICSSRIGADPAYFDGGHITASASDFWAAVLASSISKK